MPRNGNWVYCIDGSNIWTANAKGINRHRNRRDLAVERHETEFKRSKSLYFRRKALKVGGGAIGCV